MHYYIKEVLKEDKIANRTVRKVIEKIKILEIFPFSSKLLKKEKDFEYRKFIIKNYIIIYKVNLKEKEVKILHIYNQREKYQ